MGPLNLNFAQVGYESQFCVQSRQYSFSNT